MSQSVSKILLHLVFSTKDRLNLIPPEIASDLHAYLSGACRALGAEAYRVGGTANHVHVACSLPRTLAVSVLLEEIKKSSSSWMKQRDRRCAKFAWQTGYGAFSLGQSQLGAVIQYIDVQKEHHERRDFKEEFLELLQRYGVEYDEQYLWN